MSHQYCLQIGKRDMAAVFAANSVDTATGLGIAAKFRWDERARAYDKYRAEVSHRGKVKCYHLLEKNTSATALLLNKHLSIYQDWLETNEELISESIEAHAAGVKVLSLLSKLNVETTQTFTQQEDIDLALEALAKEIE